MSQITPIPLFQDIEVALLTGGQDRHYAFGLATALVAANVSVDVIGSNLVDSPEMHNTAGLRFFNLLANRKQASILRKAVQILTSYARVIQYAATGRPKILHILWNYKLPYFDRTLLMLYYKLLGKRIVFTAHNINAGRRDSMDSLLNRWTLNCQYRLANHIFVHTRRMKNELLEQYHVKETAVTLIPYGINNAVPHTGLTSIQAKDKLRIQDNEKAILFFGAIKPYKGLEYLVEAFQHHCWRAQEGERRVLECNPADNPLGPQSHARQPRDWLHS
jgi:glycosyltransferase involved in cell wall biosynthesis